MNKSEFVFNSVDLLNYNLHRISLKKGKSNIKSSEWLENKWATINPQNDDDKCFQYVLTAVLNYNRFKKGDLQKIENTEPFTNRYDKKEMDFPSLLEDWEKFEQNNESIALNILFIT